MHLLFKVQLKAKKPTRVRKRILGQSIDEQPDHINQRQIFTHWEGEGIIGKNNKGHLLTLVERSIGYGIVWDAKNRGADKIVALLDQMMQQYAGCALRCLKSIVFDNGPEFSAVDVIESKAA